MSKRVTRARRTMARKAAPGKEARAPAITGGAVTPRPRRPPSKATVVKKILKRVEAKLKTDEVRATLGDYIKLVQLEKELTDEEPREIKVTWVEPKTESEK